MAAALATAVSSVALVALGVTLIVMIPAWTWRTRVNLLGPTVLAVAASIYRYRKCRDRVAALFNDPGNDVVALARGSWAPIQGGSWPAGYRRVGVAAIAVVHFWRVRDGSGPFHRSVMLADRHLCACLMATQLIALTLGFTFAPFELGTYAVFIAITTGACAAMWRITAQESAEARPDAGEIQRGAARALLRTRQYCSAAPVSGLSDHEARSFWAS